MRGRRRALAACLLVVTHAPAAAEPQDETVAVLVALAEAGHDPDALILRMADLFDAVAVTDRVAGNEGADNRFAEFGSFSIAIALSRGGKDTGVVTCQGFGMPDLDVLAEDYRHDQSRFADALRMPLAAGAARRVLCSYYTWDGELPALVIAALAKRWGGAIGAVVSDATEQAPDRISAIEVPKQPTGEPWAMTVSRVATGSLGTVLVLLVFDERAAPS